MNSSNRPNGYARPLTIALALCLALLLSSGGASAAPEKKEGGGGKIHITADRLVSDGDGKSAEFIGNVRATQSATVITAKRLKIHYAQEKKKTGDSPMGSSIERIVATGEVTIHMDDRLAEAAKAVYTTADRVLVLTGEGSRISSGENFITGSKITLERDGGNITVERGGKKQVQAVFHSDDSGME